MTPNSYKIELLSTPQLLFVSLSSIFLSAIRKKAEKVLIPSMKIVREIGIRKLSKMKTLRKLNPAESSYVYLIV